MFYSLTHPKADTLYYKRFRVKHNQIMYAQVQAKTC